MSTDPVYRYLITNLQARHKICEMEYTALKRIIEEPATQPFERGVAMERRDALIREWAKLVDTLRLLAQKDS